jgi:hypothetical protein
MGKRTMTSQDIANALGVSYGKVNCVLAQYKEKGMPYFIRLPKKTGLRGRTIRYKISKSGLIVYLKCLGRIKRGFDLNFRGKKVKRTETDEPRSQVSFPRKQVFIFAFLALLQTKIITIPPSDNYIYYSVF